MHLNVCFQAQIELTSGYCGWMVDEKLPLRDKVFSTPATSVISQSGLINDRASQLAKAWEKLLSQLVFIKRNNYL